MDSAQDAFLRSRLRTFLRAAVRNDMEYGLRFQNVLDAMKTARLLDYPCGFGWDDEGVVGFRSVAYIMLPTGLVSWHMPECPVEHDGHTRELKEHRVWSYCNLEN